MIQNRYKVEAGYAESLKAKENDFCNGVAVASLYFARQALPAAAVVKLPSFGEEKRM